MAKSWAVRVVLVVGAAIVLVALLASAAGFERIFNNGIRINRADEMAVQILGSDGDGIHVAGTQGRAIHVANANSHGVDVASARGVGVKVFSAGNDGVRVDSAAWSGVYVGSSGHDALRVGSAGNDGLRIYEKVGRDYIRAGRDGDVDFKVTKDGTAYADGGWKGSADFAELMTVDGAVINYEPGDVLVISPSVDRSVALSSSANATSVIGVYSTKPGFIGSPNVMAEATADEIPVAIMGIVPCKASAENGPIQRGDLLTTADTPGHAMRASDARIGTILGKALGDLESGTGTIEVLLTLQ